MLADNAELFGRGGKWFVTGEAGGPHAIRTLLQPDGDIISTGSDESVFDTALARQQACQARRWIERLQRDWAAVNRQLNLIAGAVALVLTGGQLAVVDRGDWLKRAAWLAASATLAWLLRRALAHLVGRLVLRVR